jgi:microcystin-dependent protein
MANPIAVPGTNVPSGAAVSPGGAQGVQGIQGSLGPVGTMPVGTVILYVAGGTPPASWMACDGSAVSRVTYPDLFATIGTTYGAGDGSTTFNLPDLRGRTVVGVGQGTGLTNRALAATGGEEAHILSVAELASHNHTASQADHYHTIAATGNHSHSDSGHQHANDSYQPTQYVLGGGGFPTAQANANTGSSTVTSRISYANLSASGNIGPTSTNNVSATGIPAVTVNANGSGGAHNTMPPFLALFYIIKVSISGGATAQAPIADTTQPGLMRTVSGLSTDYVGGDNQCHPLSGRAGFIAKTTTYSLTTADSGKYVICSGGSWTLTLPAPVSTLTYQVRNDMGISGTTGTITLSPTGGTIDGQASISLLPQQECTLITDGTNWRTFGLKREVILGTQDITSSTAFGSILLPVGYRYFELQFNGISPVTAGDFVSGQFSINGGSTWITTGYYHGTLYNSSQTVAAFSDLENAASFYLISQDSVNPAQGKLTVWPGNASIAPTASAESGSRNTSGYQTKWQTYALISTAGPVNAFKYFMSTGNIANSFLTVKGVV